MSSNSERYGTRRIGGAHGDVFTAPGLVSYMLDLVGYTPERDLSQFSVLEPSCGEGEFAVAIARRLKSSSLNYGFDYRQAFRTQVRLYEIDAEKVACLRQRLASEGITEPDITVGDFLLASARQADFVVGNPPYVRYENIPAERREIYRQMFPTFHYRPDLYVMFYEKTLRLLTPGGRHCFVCANRWLKNEYGRRLRSMVARFYRLERIVNMEQADVFQESVLAYPAVTLISNMPPAGSFLYSEARSKAELADLSAEERPAPDGDDWTASFTPASVAQGLTTIEKQGFKIGIGVATGADSVFISPDLPRMMEAELVLPALNARDLRGNRVEWKGEYLFNPYQADGRLIDLSKYPRASSYLNRHRERLSGRHVAKKNSAMWYRTIDRIVPSLKDQAKILLPDISGNTYIFVDEGKYYPLHNLYYITGHSLRELRLLSAVLMSDSIRQQLDSITNRMNGGYLRWQSQYLRRLRVPHVRTISPDMAAELLGSYQQHDLQRINRIVGWLMSRPASGSRACVGGAARQLDIFSGLDAISWK